MWIVEDVIVGRIRVGVSVNAKIRACLSPDVIRLGRVNAPARVEISRGVGNLRRVWITRRNEAVHERRGRIAQNLLRIVLRRWLLEIVVVIAITKMAPIPCGGSAGDVCATHKTPVATLASSAALRRIFPSKNPPNPAASFR